jgi:hypothetical protein
VWYQGLCYNTESFSNTTGLGYSIDTDKDGVPYITNRAGKVYNKPSSSWVKVYDDIGYFAASPSANTFWKLDRLSLLPYVGSSSSWSQNGSLAAKIFVGPTHTWTTDSSNNIKKYNGSSWSSVSGKAQDIGVNYEGSVVNLTSTESVFIINLTESAFTGYKV